MIRWLQKPLQTRQAVSWPLIRADSSSRAGGHSTWQRDGKERQTKRRLLLAWVWSAPIWAPALALLVVGLALRVAHSQDMAFDNWLVLAVDVSGSIDAQEYSLQRDGYVEVLLDPMIGRALDRTAVSIVEFGTTAVVTVAWTDVRGAGAAYRETERPFAGNTCVACALELALSLLDGKTGKRVIDISGDGWENVRKNDEVDQLRDLATLENIEINTLALLIDADEPASLGGWAPTPKGSHSAFEKWMADLATGFAMAIVTLDDLAQALRRKLFAEIAAR